MNKHCLVIIITVMAIFCILPQAEASIFIEGWNIDATPSTSSWVATNVAWKYTPSLTYDLSRVEFYSAGADRTDMTIELRSDNNNYPGSVLTSGTFDHITTRSWQGADLTPYAVTQGEEYWVTFWPSNGLQVHITFDQDSTPIFFRGGFANDPTIYTNSQNNYKPMVKFYGDDNIIPEPVTMSLMGIGLLGFGIIKRRNKIV